MPNLALNWQNKVYINITPLSATKKWAEFGKGFKNVASSLNENVYQAAYLSDGGYQSSTVTGGQQTYTFTGDRDFNDPAQNWIFSDKVMQNWGTARETQLKIPRKDGSTLMCEITLAKITDGGGDANSTSSITVEIHVNGKPEIIPAGEGDDDDTDDTDDGSGP